MKVQHILIHLAKVNSCYFSFEYWIRVWIRRIFNKFYFKALNKQTFYFYSVDKEYFIAESAFLFRDRDRYVTVPSLGVLNRPTSLSVLNRPKPSLEQITLKNGWERLRTPKDVGRFRTHRDGTVTGWWRNGDGTVTGRSRSRNKNADSTVDFWEKANLKVYY